jgi:Flp pilus assembly protein TadB
MTLASIARLRWLLSALLVAGAALFATGVALERSSAEHHDAVEGSGHEESQSASSEETDEERVLGIDVESPWLVTIGVVASLALAVVAWRTLSAAVLRTIAAFAALFTVFDIAELAHQLGESRSGLAIYVGIVAVVHCAAAGIALFRSRPVIAD